MQIEHYDPKRSSDQFTDVGDERRKLLVHIDGRDPAGLAIALEFQWYGFTLTAHLSGDECDHLRDAMTHVSSAAWKRGWSPTPGREIAGEGSSLSIMGPQQQGDSGSVTLTLRVEPSIRTVELSLEDADRIATRIDRVWASAERFHAIAAEEAASEAALNGAPRA